MAEKGKQQTEANHPYQEGQVWFFFCATRYVIGRVQKVFPLEILLSEASWVPNTGRMYNVLLKGEFEEVEPYPSGTCVIGRLAVNDASLCNFEPPRKQK